MHQAGYDGQPVNYPQYNVTPLTLAEYCAAQSTLDPLDFLGEGFSYSSSPTSENTPLSEQILTPNSDLPQFPTRTDYSPFPCQQQLHQGPPLPATPSSKRVFLTPPPSASYKPEKTDNPLQLESPKLSPPGTQSNAHYSLSSAVNSPPSWGMSNSQQLNPPQFTWDARANMQNRNMGSHAPSYGDQLPRQMPSSTYAGSGFHPGNDATIIPQLTEKSPVSSIQEESHDKDDIVDSFQFDEEDIQPLPVASGQPEETDGAKTSVPYAQLLHRAFISAPNHKMKLQQIYQWFRENTDKANNDSKGWQNSIRHNLSMNAAFIKCDCKSGDPQETKKSTEWKLSDWAVRDGVQSTTRYRKGNPARRGSSSHQGSGTARSSSGRKGGSSAGKGRIVGSKRTILSRSTDQELLNRHIDPFQGPVYNRPISYNYGPTTLNTHPTPGPTDWMGRPLYPTATLPTPTGELNTYAYNNPSHPHTMGGVQQRDHTQALYPTAEMMGNYGGSQIPPNARVNNSSIALSPRYGDFFPNSQEPADRPNYFTWNSASGGGPCP